MIEIKVIESSPGQLEKYSVSSDNQPLTYKDVLMNLNSDVNFRTQFIACLSNSSFSSYRFETPSLSKESENQYFEFVLINSPELKNHQNKKPFSDYMKRSDENVISFLNLSKSSELIIPNAVTNQDIYAHFASFIRNAPSKQIHDLLKLTSQKTLKSISSKNIWLSTAGAGVSWLHIRIDKTPKYYKYKPYKTSKRSL